MKARGKGGGRQLARIAAAHAASPHMQRVRDAAETEARRRGAAGLPGQLLTAAEIRAAAQRRRERMMREGY